jgi:hypothetical protein
MHTLIADKVDALDVRGVARQDGAGRIGHDARCVVPQQPKCDVPRVRYSLQSCLFMAGANRAIATLQRFSDTQQARQVHHYIIQWHWAYVSILGTILGWYRENSI